MSGAMDNVNVEEMARKFVSGLPAALSSMRAELEANFRAALQGAAGQFDRPRAASSTFKPRCWSASASVSRSSRLASPFLRNARKNAAAVFLNGCTRQGCGFQFGR